MTLIAAQDVHARYGARAALGGVSFEAGAGELVGLVGPNGAGKTTLLRVLAGLMAPAAGRVIFDGQPFGDFGRRELAQRLAYLPQGAPVHWPLKVAKLVALGRLPHLDPWRSPGPDDEHAIARAMDAAEVREFADRSITTLSSGERTRAMIARALAVEPQILLADEPVTALDPYHQLKVMELLRERVREGMAVVVVLHDLNLAGRFCDRLVLLDEGRVVTDGAPEHVLAPEFLRSIYGIEADYGPNGAGGDGSFFVVPRERVKRREGRRGTEPRS